MIIWCWLLRVSFAWLIDKRIPRSGFLAFISLDTHAPWREAYLNIGSETDDNEHEKSASSAAFFPTGEHTARQKYPLASNYFMTACCGPARRRKRRDEKRKSNSNQIVDTRKSGFREEIKFIAERARRKQKLKTVFLANRCPLHHFIVPRWMIPKRRRIEAFSIIYSSESRASPRFCCHRRRRWTSRSAKFAD